MDCTIPDLDQAAADLAEVFDAGLVNDLKEEIALARRGLPRNDFDAYPGLKFDVQVFGDMLADFTGQPQALCKLVALHQLLPGNRHRQAMDILHDFAERHRAAKNQQKASSILQFERRRAGR